MEEIWKDIAGYAGLYRVSNHGNVMSVNYGGWGGERLLTPKCNNRGRLWVELFGNGKRKPMLIHRLVAEAFVPNPNNYPQVNHKDENTQNNRADNLEWCTASYNVQYYFDHRRAEGKLKEKQPVVRCRKNSQHNKCKHLPIVQETLDGDFVRLWKNSREVLTELGWSDWSVAECCRGNRKTAYGFTWRYAN